MIFNSYLDAEKYLQNQQVYFHKEIVNSDFKTLAEAKKVYNVGNVSIKRLREDTIALSITINGDETTIYQYQNNKAFFSWLKTTFIPVPQLVKSYL